MQEENQVLKAPCEVSADRMRRPALCIYPTVMHDFQFTLHKQQRISRPTAMITKHFKTFYFILNAKKPSWC